jgi:phage terminase large subunit
VLSSEWDWIYVNQAEELTVNDWELLTTRATGRGAVMPYTQIGGDCNPAGRLHWIRDRASTGRVNLFPTVHQNNPTLYDPATGEITEQGKRTMATLDNLTGVRRQRLLLGQWATAEGTVYDTFSVDVHVKERDMGEFTRWGIACDEGYTNPAVMLLVGEDPDGRLHIAREYYRRGVLQSAFVSECAVWCDDYDVYQVIVDQAAAGLIADMRNAGIPAQGHKGRVLDGIQTVQNYLAIQGDGKPRLTIDPACVDTINEFESYVWKPEKDEPIKDNDHAMDALRYYVDNMGGPAAWDLIAAV